MNVVGQSPTPLSTAQRGMWISQKMAPAGATMNIAEAVEILGPVDPPVFQAALRRLVDEAQMLRVNVIEQDGKPWQVLQPVYRGEFPLVDVSNEPDPWAAAEAWMLDELTRPLDLAEDPLWFSALFKAADDRYYWYQRAHHIMFDGFSGGLIARRLAELYTAAMEGREPAPADFAAAAEPAQMEAQYRDSERFQRDREYWLQQLDGLPEAVTLSRLPHKHGLGIGLRRSVGHLSAPTTARLAELGKRAGASLPQVLIALVAAYYQRVTGVEDLVIGMPVSGRANAAMRRAPGVFANVVGIRLRFEPGMTALDLFAQVSRAVRQSLRHQQYRYEDVRRDLGLVGPGQNVARLGVNIEPFDYQLNFAGATTVPHNISNSSAEDLMVFVYDRGTDSGLRFDLDANPSLYEAAELDEHRRRLLQLIEAVLDQPETALRQVDILGESERRRLLWEWNLTEALLPSLSLPAQIAQFAASQPDAPAVVFEDRVLSYRQLHERSVLQARQWIADGVEPGDIVAVALPRSEQLLIVLLAIMRTGAAYLPIDLDAPTERTALVLDDASPIALVTLPTWRERFDRGGLIMLEPEQLDASLETITDEPDRGSPEQTAYVLYTSGSTGRPKGVEVSRRNLANFLLGMQRQLQPRSSDRFMAVTTVIFDIAGLELYLPLTVGARVVMASAEALRNPGMLARLIQHSGATHVQATPSLWRILLASSDAQLDRVHALVGGEALSVDLAARLKAMAARVTQFYGPTETTVWSTAHELAVIGEGTPPIGRPITNTRLYVLDDERQLLPTGAVGELYIGGAGVAKGYLHRPQLTEERFPLDPFLADGSRMYRTGDLVRWNEQGLLEFVGRADSQVKIRGHRVELGEIESQLLQHDAISQVAVTAHRDGDGAVAVAAYLVAAPGCAIELDRLRMLLAVRLPDYMMPAHFLLLDALPLTPNGKLDRKALPVPERRARAAFAEPVTANERKLAELWKQVLGVERVGLHDDFFELGGDSVSATEMVARFPQHFGLELPLSHLFEASTIAGLAGVIERLDGADNDPLSVLLPLRVPARLHGVAIAAQRPLFCFHPVAGLSLGFSALLRHLDPAVPVYGLQSRGLHGDTRLPCDLDEVAADYLAQIRRVQPHGPYRLLGRSMGGLIAHAVAERLRGLGEQIELLAMIDSYLFTPSERVRPSSEAEEVRAALGFLGLHEQARKDAPQTLNELANLLLNSYNTRSVPLVKEILKSHPQFIEHLFAVMRNNLTLTRQYVPRKLDVDLLYFQATRREGNLDGILDHRPAAWRPFVGGRIEVHELDCHHEAVLDPLPATQIGMLLRQRLAQALPMLEQGAPPIESDEGREGLATAYA